MNITFRTLFAFLLFLQLVSIGQTTQSLTLEQCEELFLRNNLSVLAKQYNIDSKTALIIQAKSYPNPVFNADFNIYDPQNNKFLHIDSSGQKAFQIEQMISIAGKRKTEIDIAKQNKILAESEFSDLLRNLKVQLYVSFYSVNSERLVLENYERQLEILDTIISAYKIQADKGNLPLKDIIRLKSVYIKLNGNKSQIAIDYSQQLRNLQFLVNTNSNIVPLVDENNFQNYLDLKALNDLQTLAVLNRPDLKIADETAILAALNLKYQKKQTLPGIAVNASYDQRGGAFHNQINAGLSVPLPVFNTNRGNIKAAQFDKKAIELYASEKKLEVEIDTQQAWANMQKSIRDFVKVRALFNNEFTLVNKGVNDNFRKRNISILEFVDFVEAYNESLADFEGIKKQLAISAAQLNYVTASKIY